MKKSLKLFSSALAIGMLLGTAAPAMTGIQELTTTVQASDKTNQYNSEKLEEGDVTVNEDGVITAFNNAEKAANLLNGGGLIIPDTIGEGDEKVTITGISGPSTFRRTRLRNLAPGASGDGIRYLTFEKPSNIKTIGERAFYENQLTEVDLPQATSIGDRAFGRNQISTINLPSASSIGAAAFASNELTEVDLPQTLSLGPSAFSVNQLEKINLPRATVIEELAFSANQLTTLDLPQVTSIGRSAFSGNLLTNITLPTTVSIDQYAFYENKLTEIDVPKATSIGYAAFSKNQLTTLRLPETTMIGDYAFSNNELAKAYLPEAINIGQAAFRDNQIDEIDLPEASSIGNNAFDMNKLTRAILPKASSIGSMAFNENQLTEVDLPTVETIEGAAFYGNQLTSIDLPEATHIGSSAFGYNKLMHIKLPAGTEIGSEAFFGQNLSQEIEPEAGKIMYSDIKPKLLQGTDDKIPAISQIHFLTSEIDASSEITHDNGVSLKAADDMIKLTGADYSNPFSLDLRVFLQNSESSIPGDYSISSYELTINPFEGDDGGDPDGGDPDGGGSGSGGNPGNGTQPDNNGNGNETDTNPDTGNGGESGNNNGNETKPQPAPKPEEKRPHTVYAKRGMRLHRNVSLTSPIRSYKKQSRAKAPSFRVRGVEYDKNGKKRYKVDGGYITAGASYVADSHFRSNKVRQVRVLSNRVNSYKDVKLSSNKKVRSYKKGTKLRVKRVVNWGRATRFELTNGRYITGNKQLLIMDQK